MGKNEIACLMNKPVQLYSFAVTFCWVGPQVNFTDVAIQCVYFYFSPRLIFFHFGANASCMSSFECGKIESANHIHCSSFSSMLFVSAAAVYANFSCMYTAA